MENVNSTRMELLKLQAKLKTAKNGHKLLKEKVSELVRNFYVLVKELKEKRLEVESLQKHVFQEYEFAKTKLFDEEINLLFAMPNHVFELDFSTDNFLGIEVPNINVCENVLDSHMPYSPLSSTSSLDKTVQDFYNLFPKLVYLASLEKKVNMVCDEIEKGKRRVNSLENVLIPNYESKILEIENKLSENERSNLARLMKVKNMIIDKQN